MDRDIPRLAPGTPATELQPIEPFVVEVLAVGETEYVRNGMTFATAEDAFTYGSDLLWRWLGAETYRVVDTRTGEVVVRS